MWGRQVKNVDILEYVWTEMITSLKQADIVVVKIHRCNGNHKSKINNRYTKTKKKRTQAYY